MSLQAPPGGQKPPVEEPRAAPRSRTLAFGGLLLGSGLGLLTSAQTWWTAGSGAVSVTFSGTDATGGLSQALAAVALVGTLLAGVLRARARRALGLVLGVAGIGMVVLAWSGRPSATAVQAKLRTVTLAEADALSRSAWPVAYGVAGGIVAAAAVVMVLRAGRWPVRTDRFARPGASPPTAPMPAAAPSPEDQTPVDRQESPALVDLSDDPASAWRALDAGRDPTVGGHPDSGDGRRQDTMGADRPPP